MVWQQKLRLTWLKRRGTPWTCRQSVAGLTYRNKQAFMRIIADTWWITLWTGRLFKVQTVQDCLAFFRGHMYSYTCRVLTVNIFYVYLTVTVQNRTSTITYCVALWTFLSQVWLKIWACSLKWQLWFHFRFIVLEYNNTSKCVQTDPDCTVRCVCSQVRSPRLCRDSNWQKTLWSIWLQTKELTWKKSLPQGRSTEDGTEYLKVRCEEELIPKYVYTARLVGRKSTWTVKYVQWNMEKDLYKPN